AEGVVEVPGHVLETPAGGLEEIIVLPTLPTVAIPIANRALDRKDAHPLLNIGNRAEGDGIDSRAVRVFRRTDGVNEREDLRVIVCRGGANRPLAEHEAVRRRLHRRNAA